MKCFKCNGKVIKMGAVFACQECQEGWPWEFVFENEDKDMLERLFNRLKDRDYPDTHTAGN